MSLKLRTEYWDDPKARGAFKRFLIDIHGLDLSEWESGGYWDEGYTPFSFFDGDEIVSSVCVYSLEAVIDGEAGRLAQISSVGTLPERRLEGLNRRLTDAGLEWARKTHKGVFLFADTEAIHFYNACGFRPIDEYVEFAEAPAATRTDGAVKLDPGEKHDLDKIYKYAEGRAPISDRFSVLNAKLLMFHAMYLLRNDVYEIPDLDCLVFFKREEGCLKIFDIVGERVPLLEELHPYIADESDEIIEFHFHADKLGIDGIKTKPLCGNNPFVIGAFPIDRPVFPFTSRA